MYKTISGSQRPIAKPEAIICFCTDRADKKQRLACTQTGVDAKVKKLIAEVIDWPECTGKLGEVNVAGPVDSRRVVVVGLGKRDDIKGNTIRAASDGLIKRLHRMGIRKAEILTPAENLPLIAEEFMRAFGEGVGLANFVFETFKSSTRDNESVGKLTLHVSGVKLGRALDQGLTMAESVNFARQWAATPPNVATTTRIAEVAGKLARTHKTLACRVIKGKELETHKLVGLRNVGKASENAPCLIQLTYTPTRKAKGCVLLVGKTIVYDTGGLSIKPTTGMKGMKYDKCGGMAVLGAMQAVARMKPKCKIVALLPTAENSISDEAYRPDDILTYPNGVTVEVTNTDAEGRLVLADALHYGCRKIKPDAIIDIATLTGGVVVALGDTCAGLWCEDDKLRERLDKAAEASGERLWRLPLFDDYREMMKSQHADIWNSAPVRHAHPIQGAAFLSYFVDEKIPWAHLDIAGVAGTEKDKPPYVTGPTGFGVRLFTYLLENW